MSSNDDKTGTMGQTSDPIDRPYTFDEIVPSSTPLTIPYLEIYRTNELEYVEYQSPYLNQSSTSDDAIDSDGDGIPDSEEEDSQNAAALWSALSQVVLDHYPNLPNKDTWIGKLRDAPVTWSGVAEVTNGMGKPTNGSQNQIIERILSIKEQYSHTTRQSYATTQKAIKVAGTIINHSPKAQKIIKGMQGDKIYVGRGANGEAVYTNNIATNKIGNILGKIQTISQK